MGNRSGGYRVLSGVVQGLRHQQAAGCAFMHYKGRHEISPAWRLAGRHHHNRYVFIFDAGRMCPYQRLFENRSLIKNKKRFWVPPYFQKRRHLLKLFGKSFTKNLYNFRIWSLTFQTDFQSDIGTGDSAKAPGATRVCQGTLTETSSSYDD
ncbi:hypothetical protein RI056_08415 [Komagataeibacter nataicola]|uniref:hypothetical protein n=1 Tax=Komagataeibacter nataicola TaxID=265960 RepID=UPI0028B11998|nr:hypothetical protein [Komagataeibacter nataicola]WNM09866.1 hypothetical protein RI056_08415 [Komagataeibacter nataicola]